MSCYLWFARHEKYHDSIPAPKELGLYYLQSRYYDPELCRFLNADIFVSTGQGELGNNMFAYCRNNPIARTDISGTADYDCVDDSPHDEEDILDIGRGGGPGSTPTDSNGGGSPGGGYSYVAPSGGGGVSSSIQVGDTTVTFGHGGRHVGLSNISGLENAIAQDVVMRAKTSGEYGRLSIHYDGVSFTYHYFMRSATLINVGTYYYTVAM